MTNYVVTNENVYDIDAMNVLSVMYDITPLRLNIAQNWSENEVSNDEISFDEDQLNHLKYWKNNIMGKPNQQIIYIL